MIGGGNTSGRILVQQSSQQQNNPFADQEQTLLSQNLLFRGDEAFLLDSFFSSLEETDSLANITPFGLNLSALSPPISSNNVFPLSGDHLRSHSSASSSFPSLQAHPSNDLMERLQMDSSASPHPTNLSIRTNFRRENLQNQQNQLTSPTGEILNEGLFAQPPSHLLTGSQPNEQPMLTSPVLQHHQNVSESIPQKQLPLFSSGFQSYQGQELNTQRYYTQPRSGNISPLSPSVPGFGISPDATHESLRNTNGQKGQIGIQPDGRLQRVLSTGQLTPPHQDATLLASSTVHNRSSSKTLETNLPSPVVSNSSSHSLPPGQSSLSSGSSQVHIPTTHPDTLFVREYARAEECHLVHKPRRKSQAPQHEVSSTDGTRSISRQNQDLTAPETMFPSQAEVHSISQSQEQRISSQGDEHEETKATRKRGRPKKNQIIPAVAQAAIEGKLQPPPPLSTKQLSQAGSKSVKRLSQPTPATPSTPMAPSTFLQQQPDTNSDAVPPAAKKSRRGRPPIYGPTSTDPNNRELLSESQKRANHVASEQKRREMIRNGFQALVNLTPSLRNSGPLPNGPGNTSAGHSKSDILFRVAEYIEELHTEISHLRGRLRMDEQEDGSRNDSDDDTAEE